MMYFEVSMGEDGQAGRINLGLWAELIGVSREIVGFVAVSLPFGSERFFEHDHQALQLRLAVASPWMRQRGANRVGLDLLETDHIGERTQRRNGSGDPLHGGARARYTTCGVTEVPNVVREDP
jgi:hypothetical protein